MHNKRTKRPTVQLPTPLLRFDRFWGFPFSFSVPWLAQHQTVSASQQAMESSAVTQHSEVVMEMPLIICQVEQNPEPDLDQQSAISIQHCSDSMELVEHATQPDQLELDT